MYGYTCEVSPHFARIRRRLMLLAEMVWITADQSQIILDLSPVRMVMMWLLRTSYNSYYTVVVLLYV